MSEVEWCELVFVISQGICGCIHEIHLLVHVAVHCKVVCQAISVSGKMTCYSVIGMYGIETK